MVSFIISIDNESEAISVKSEQISIAYGFSKYKNKFLKDKVKSE